MKYQLIENILWYLGHLLGFFAIIANHYNYFIAIPIAFTGQFITIISRPISRLEKKDNIPIELNNV